MVAFLPLTIIIYLVFKFKLKYNQWHWFDILSIIIPGILYSVLDVCIKKPKTLSNVLELIIIGILAAILFLFRAKLGKNTPVNSKTYSFVTFISISLLTIIFYFLVPALTE